MRKLLNNGEADDSVRVGFFFCTQVQMYTRMKHFLEFLTDVVLPFLCRANFFCTPVHVLSEFLHSVFLHGMSRWRRKGFLTKGPRGLLPRHHVHQMSLKRNC